MRTFQFRVGLVLSAVLLAGACGDDDGSTYTYTAADIKDQTVDGRLNGQHFTLVTASVFGDYSTTLNVSLYRDQTDPCYPDNSLPYISFTVDRAEGEYPLYVSGEGAQIVYFGSGSSPFATEGIIVVEYLGASSVTIGIVADAGDGRNIINGRFTADIQTTDICSQ